MKERKIEKNLHKWKRKHKSKWTKAEMRKKFKSMNEEIAAINEELLVANQIKAQLSQEKASLEHQLEESNTYSKENILKFVLKFNEGL